MSVQVNRISYYWLKRVCKELHTKNDMGKWALQERAALFWKEDTSHDIVNFYWSKIWKLSRKVALMDPYLHLDETPP